MIPTPSLRSLEKADSSVQMKVLEHMMEPYEALMRLRFAIVRQRRWVLDLGIPKLEVGHRRYLYQIASGCPYL